MTTKAVRTIKAKKYKWGDIDSMTLGTLTAASHQAYYGIDPAYNTTTTTGSSEDAVITWNNNTTATPYYFTQDTHTTNSPLLFDHRSALELPKLKEFDDDYDVDTQDTEDPLNIMKRLARGCYKGNSCVDCNNERIKEEYIKKYNRLPRESTWADITSPTDTTSVMSWSVSDSAGGWRSITSNNAGD